jgi:hypothetical protein
MSRLDQRWKNCAHRATARYTVYLTAANFAKGRTVIEPGLTSDAANLKCDELNAGLVEPRFGEAMYGIELEQ